MSLLPKVVSFLLENMSLVGTFFFPKAAFSVFELEKIVSAKMQRLVFKGFLDEHKATKKESSF